MKRLICSTCGWTAPAPEAPTQFGTAVGRFMVAAGHTLSMALLDGGRREHHVQLQPPPVTVTIDLDASRYTAALEQSAERLREIRYQNTLRGERTAARRWWGDYIAATYAVYGWEWPGPVERTAR